MSRKLRNIPSPFERLNGRRKSKNVKPVNFENHVIFLHGDMRTAEPPVAQCTCGWSFGPDANLMKLGVEAKKHSVETGHEMRKHG